MLFHAWFSTKYRRHSLVGETSKRAKDLLWECVHRHRYDVVDLSANGDHVHILLRASDRCELAAIRQIQNDERCSVQQYVREQDS
jgi:REP element-mobilizing transposase RayT